MSRNRKSSAAKESVSSEPQQDDTATAPPVAETVSGPAGSQMPAGDNTRSESSGDAVGEASAELVKPHDKDGTPTPVIVTEATNSQSGPEAEASASGSESPSQGDAAGGTGANAGPAISLAEVLAEAGADDVGELLYFAGFGKQLVELVAPLGVDPATVLTGFEPGGFVGVDPARPGSDVTAMGVFSPGEGYRSFGGLRVKSKRDGWRRAGIVHSKAGHDFRPDDLTPDQVRLIVNDHNLIVELL